MASPERLYKKRAGTTGIAGQLYEIKMCSVVSLRGVREEEFHLATNVDAAGAFDDMGLRFYKDDGSHRISLVQLKHTVQTISRGKLLSTSKTNSYGLLKYYLSYRKDIKPQFHNRQSNDPLFICSLDDLTLVFYTNASISGIPDTSCQQDDILSTGRNGCIYRFSKDRDPYVWDVWEEWNTTVPDLGDISEYEEFLSKLVLYTKQATESELDDIIQMELKQTLKVTQQIAGDMLSKFHNHIQVWWGSEIGQYLTKNCSLWSDIIEDTLTMINNELKQEIRRLDVRFSDEEMLLLSGRLGESRVVLCLVDSKNTSLNFCKVVQVLERNNQRFVLGSSEAALGFWQSHWGGTLVLEGKDCYPKLLEMCLGELKMCPNKKLVVVLRTDEQQVVSRLRGSDSPGVLELIDTVNLCSLESLSAEKMLSKAVNFQGHHISLKELLKDDLGKTVNNNIDSLLESLSKLSNVLKDSQNEFPYLQKYHTDSLFSIISYLVNSRNVSPERNMDKGIFVELHKYESLLLKELDQLFANIKPMISFFQIESIIEKMKYLRDELETSQMSPTSDNDKNIHRLKKLLRDLPKEEGMSQLGQHKVSTDTLIWFIKNERQLQICLKTIVIGDNNILRIISSIREEFLKRSAALEGRKFPKIGKGFMTHFVDDAEQHDLLYMYLQTIESLKMLSKEVVHDCKCLRAIISELTLMESLNSDMLFSLLKGDPIRLGAPSDVPIKYYIPRSLKRESVMPAEVASDVEGRVAVVVAEPGMGKSVLMTHVAQQTKSKDRSMWVIKVILNKMTSYFKSIGSSPVNKSHVLNILRLAADVKQRFEDKLLEHMLHYTGRVIIFLDGFDEVCPNYKHIMFRIITELKLTEMKQVWISSRTYMKRDLEKCTQTRAFEIVGFSETDQICLLRQVWSERMEKVDQIYLSTFIQGVIRQVSHSSCDTERSFMEIPQQTLLVAEAFERELLEGYTEEKLEPALRNITDLYARFFERKCDIFFEEKEGIDTSKREFILKRNEIIKDIEEHHVSAALLSFFSTDELLSLGINTKAQKHLIEYEQKWARIGIVAVSDGIPKFSHRTMEEYFVAKWITRNFQSCRELILKKLFTVEYNVVKGLFDNMLSNDCSLHLNVMESNVDMVEKAVNVHTVNKRDAGGRTPLHLAITAEASENSRQVMKLLLNNGADVSSTDTVLNYSPIDYIEITENVAVLDMLLEKSNCRHKLHFLQENKGIFVKKACVRGNLQILRYFAREGFNMNRRIDDFGRRPLHVACMWGQPNVVKYLLGDYRIDRNAVTCIVITRRRVKMQTRDILGKTALHFACADGNPNIVRQLIQMGSNVDECDLRKFTPLHYAAQNGHLHVARILVEAGCNINALTTNNLSPLLTAVITGKIDVMKFLLNEKCNFTTRDMSGQTALHIAALYGYHDTARLLIDAGCKVDDGDNSLHTPLHFAAKKGHVALARLLVEAKCQLDSRNNDQETPLHLATKHGHGDIVKLLLEYGCKVHPKDKCDRTPLQYVEESGYEDIVRLLTVSCCKDDQSEVDLETSTQWIEHLSPGDTVHPLIVPDLKFGPRDKNKRSALPNTEEKKPYDTIFVPNLFNTKIHKDI